ncbi:hypothetical protein Cni_G22392 [Canna indica]|uniref:Reverse transcriptase zinc-binding domain-containing protein n=1 Tax=Canna indica TaxID=4628 RepID=A0AAQ3QLL1_9LILI|nr:hypothetical protein Cni_G22392 [Canna indica]
MTGVFEVIKAAKNFKSPGSNNLNMEFYEKFSPLIGNQVLDILLQMQEDPGRQEADIGGKCLVGWDALTRSRYEGGLGILNLRTQNLARLEKWIWKLLQPEGMPWKEIDSLSHVWRGICIPFDIFGISLFCRVGGTSSFRVWLDPWFNGERMNSRHPSIFPAACNQMITIDAAKTRASSGEIIKWSIQFRHLVPTHLLNRLAEDLVPFLHCSGSDGYGWRCYSDGIFSTSSLYWLLNFRGTADPWVSFLWQNNFPPALSLNNSLIEKRRILTRGRLIKHNITVLASCPLCNNFDESHSHLFKDCSLLYKDGESSYKFCDMLSSRSPTLHGRPRLYGN